MGTTTTQISTTNGSAAHVAATKPSANWRSQAISAALRANIHYGEGESEILRRIRLARPDAAIAIISVLRDQLIAFFAKRGVTCEVIEPITEKISESGEIDYCTGWLRTEWEGAPLEIAFAPGNYERGDEYLIGDSAEQVRSLARTLSNEAIRPVGRSLRFTSCWERASDLDAELGKVTWDDVVLPPQLFAEIRESVDAFFAHQEVYRSMGFAWRRGLLLVGPPGTGKTMICKAIAASQPSLPFLYVRDIRDQRGASDAVKSIFTRARKLAPCILAFEDIDGMVNDERRTVFLNELDGFKDNDGLFVIASSNHPGKIDEALLKRPSRFDRVFHIGLPEAEEREAFCLNILRRDTIASRIDPALDLEALAKRTASDTDGFTPAYLKEALVSAALIRAQSGALLLDDAYALEVARQVDLLSDYIRRAKKSNAWAEMRSTRDSRGFRS